MGEIKAQLDALGGANPGASSAGTTPASAELVSAVDTIIAGVGYAISRYGSVSNVPGVAGLQ